MPSNVTAYQIAFLWFNQRDLNEGPSDIEALAALIERERLLAGAGPGQG